MAKVSTRGAASEILPRYVFLEPLFPGAKVLEVDAIALTGGLSARFLMERGAAQVLAIDVDEAAVAKAAENPDLNLENLAFRAADYRGLRTGEYDLVIVHSPVDLATDPKSLVTLKHQLASSGRLVLVVRKPAGLALADTRPKSAAGELADDDYLAALKKSFQTVELAVQTAFVGYTITPTGVAEPATALDESLIDQAAPAYHLYVCGSGPAGLDTAALTPLPSATLTDLISTAAEGAPIRLSLLDDFDQELAEKRIRELEVRTQSALEEAQRSELQLAQVLAERDHLQAKLTALRDQPPPAAPADPNEVASLNQALASATAEARSKSEALATVSGELKAAMEQTRVALEQREELAREATTLRAQLESTAASGASRDGELDALKTELAQAVSRAKADLETKNVELRASDEALARARGDVEQTKAAVASGNEQHAAALQAQLQARSDAGRLTGELQATREQAAALRNQLEELQGEASQASDESGSLRTQLEQATQAEAQARSEIAATQQRADQAELRARSATEVAERAGSTANEKLAALNAELESTRKAFAVAKEERDLLEQMLREETEKFTAAAKEREHSIAGIHADLATKLAALEEQLRVARAEAEALRGPAADASALQGRIAELDAQLAERNAKGSALEGDVAALRERVANLETDTGVLRHKAAALDEQLVAAQAQGAALRGPAAEAPELKAKVAALQEQLAALTAEADSLRERASRASVLEAEVAELNDQLASGAAAPAPSDEVAALKEEVAALKFEADILREAATGSGELQRQIEALTEELSQQHAAAPAPAAPSDEVAALKAELDSANKLREAAEAAAQDAHDKLEEVAMSQSERTQIVQSPLEEKKLS